MADTRIHINPASIILVVFVIGSVFFAYWKFTADQEERQRAAELAEKERELDLKRQHELELKQMEVRKEKARVAALREKERLEQQRIRRLEREKRREKEQLRLAEERKKEELRQKAEAARLEAEEAAELKRLQQQQKEEQARLDADRKLDARERAKLIEKLKTEYVKLRGRISEHRKDQKEQEGNVVGCKNRIASMRKAVASLTRRLHGTKDARTKGGKTHGVTVVQPGTSERASLQKRIDNSNAEIQRLSQMQVNAQGALTNIQSLMTADVRKFEDVKTQLTAFGVDPTAPAISKKKPSEAKKTVILKDGTEIQATNIVDAGDDLVIKDVKGKFHTVKKKDVKAREKK